VDPSLVAYAVSLAEATRNPAMVGLADLSAYVEYGASPRGPIALVQSARPLARQGRAPAPARAHLSCARRAADGGRRARPGAAGGRDATARARAAGSS